MCPLNPVTNIHTHDVPSAGVLSHQVRAVAGLQLYRFHMGLELSNEGVSSERKRYG
jgi:hypothetical protein